MTRGQTDVAWFFLRMFRVTSSVAARLTRTLWVNQNQPSAECLLIVKVLGFVPLDDSDPTDETREAQIASAHRFTVRELKEFIKTVNDNLPADQQKIKTTATKQKMIDALLQKKWNPDQHVSAKEQGKTIEQSFHDAFFMKEVSGDSLRIGSLNEKHILKWLPEFVWEHSREYQVAGHSLVGLLARNEMETVGTSPDGLIILERTQQGPDKYTACMVEMKTRSSTATMEKIRRIRREHGRFLNLYIRYSNSTPWTEMKTFLPNMENRQQALHHAAVTGVRHTLFVEATVHGIEYIVLIKYHESVLTAYRNAILKPLSEHLAVFHALDEDSDLVEILQPEFNKLQDPGTAVDFETYKLAVATWILFNKMVKDNKEPMYDCYRFLPAMVNAWNKLKG